MKPLHSSAWSLGTVAAAGLVAWGVAEFTLKRDHGHHHDHGSEHSNLHDWLHENLGISAEQEAVLLPIELAFEKEAERCQSEIETAGLELAQAIRDYPENSGEIDRARLKLHEAKGRLEEITLAHFFAMKKHLSPEQGEKLLNWTHESLLHGFDH